MPDPGKTHQASTQSTSGFPAWKSSAARSARQPNAFGTHQLIPLHDLVGYGAAILTTLAFIPQTLKSWRTRDLSGVSLGMYSLFTLGVGLWLTYGILLGSWPIILANTITLGLAGTVLFLKLRHK